MFCHPLCEFLTVYSSLVQVPRRSFRQPNKKDVQPSPQPAAPSLIFITLHSFVQPPLTMSPDQMHSFRWFFSPSGKSWLRRSCTRRTPSPTASQGTASSFASRCLTLNCTPGTLSSLVREYYYYFLQSLKGRIGHWGIEGRDI